MTRLLAALAFLALISAAAAQTVPFSFPNTSSGGLYAWPWVLSTSSVQVLPANPLRKQIVFINPSATATVAVCPAVNRRNSTPITCAVNGAGALTLLPFQSFEVNGAVGDGATISGPPGGLSFLVPSAWNGVGSSPNSPLTILEWE